MAKRVWQYKDRTGKIWVASYPVDESSEPWLNEMIDQYGLEKLCEMYPYQIITMDASGEFKPAVDCTYNAMVTNWFHIRLAMKKDESEPEEYRLRLADAYPDHDEPVVRDIAPPAAEKIIEKDEDGYRIDYEHMPEEVTIKGPGPGFHPNKDANGNYMANPKVAANQWGSWGNGYYGTWGNTYNPWSYNNTVYPYGPSNAQYGTFSNIYF